MDRLKQAARRALAAAVEAREKRQGSKGTVYAS